MINSLKMLEIAYFIAVAIITFLIHFILYALSQFDRKKKQEKLMIENAALILDKIDQIKEPLGGLKMDKDLKKVAMHLSKKLDDVIDRLEELEGRFDEMEGEEEPEEEFEDDESPFDDEEEDAPEAKLEPPEPPKPLDIRKRQIKYSEQPEEEEKPKRKKGLFGLGKQK